MNFQAEAAERYVVTINNVSYVGDLVENRKSTVVSHINIFTDSSNFQLQIAGVLHYVLSFENEEALIAFNNLRVA